jgi:hypothetical protein
MYARRAKLASGVRHALLPLVLAVSSVAPLRVLRPARVRPRRRAAQGRSGLRGPLPQRHAARGRELFLPSAVASPNPDSTTRLRSLDKFYAAQGGAWPPVAIRETLESVKIERQPPASVWADFVLADAGDTSRGRLVLLMMAEQGHCDPL